MNFDIIDVYAIFTLIALGFSAGVWVGRLKEKTLAQAAMINAMRQVNRAEEEFHQQVSARLREKMGLSDKWEEELDV